MCVLCVGIIWNSSSFNPSCLSCYKLRFMPSHFCSLFLYLLHYLFACICYFVCQNEFNDVNITLATIMIVIGTIDQHYTTHTCTCTYQCLLHCHTLNSLFTFPKFFLLPLHYYCYQSVWSVPVMLCNNCRLQSTLCLWL